MKFKELKMRDLYAHANNACIEVVDMLPKEEKEKFENLVVCFVSPMAITPVEKNIEFFTILGIVLFTDDTHKSFKADLIWDSDENLCVLPSPDDNVKFLDVDLNVFSPFS